MKVHEGSQAEVWVIKREKTFNLFFSFTFTTNALLKITQVPGFQGKKGEQVSYLNCCTTII